MTLRPPPGLEPVRVPLGSVGSSQAQHRGALAVLVEAFWMALGSFKVICYFICKLYII